MSLPEFDLLSRQQQNAILMPLKRDNAVLVSGCPGSGKTTVVLHRLCYLRDTVQSEVLYLVYAKLLAQYIRDELQSPNIKIETVHSWYFRNTRRYLCENDYSTPRRDVPNQIARLKRQLGIKEYYLDEAQDLSVDLVGNLLGLSDSVFVCADSAQDVFGNVELDVDLLDALSTKIEESNKTLNLVHLDVNYRNTKFIYEFANSCFPNINAAAIRSFAREEGSPVQIMHNKNREEMYDKLIRLCQNWSSSSIGILTATVSSVNAIHYRLEVEGLPSVKYHNKVKIVPKVGNLTVTTFKSSKGLEFDMVIVPNADLLPVNEVSQLKEIYVALTRSKEGLFILTQNGILPNWCQTAKEGTFIISE